MITLHAITLTSSSGTEILIHIGLDTVTLKGAPFTAHVAAGDQVKKGDLLMDVDLDKITGAGLNTVTPVLICNTDDYEKISLKKEGEVSLDEAFSVFPDLFDLSSDESSSSSFMKCTLEVFSHLLL